MNVANDQNNNLIHAKLSVKGTAYFCPKCKEIVVRAGGGGQQVHFRHKVGGNYVACELFVKGLESDNNAKQREIYDASNVLFINDMNLVEGIDYTILSYKIEDLNRNMVPLLRFCNLNQKDVKEFSKVLEYIRGGDLKYKAMWKICNYQIIKKEIFKIVNHSDVDINVAIDKGFGVLQLHKGDYAGQKFLFDLSYRVAETDPEMETIFAELLGVQEPLSKRLDSYINDAMKRW
ncbi:MULTISPECIES: hypothetical protein [unclassified Paenibacillus]|uniref:hypothetical protein n=1 Tax=unclassified Paenibacillus TaxID=185978 RepID=UPI0024068D7B|nr:MULTISPECIES: hypothetical protein [unclassified Paenibacillus]MDF9844959.1 hypothetical protein [Paenibacillus sp. PastF-2]MDF9851558.1 hypothetical protein [Paenibacillus sp. PastM-2]MDF9858142.1 hypothetical protein [Paenibacillus sp. PastF-1]MDH6483368.1 hypothetical protein [Paenibacillus sp. PastH-2]MDH6510818.1 hypothetical protein [Paenibacillus sp. PastM-3]